MERQWLILVIGRDDQCNECNVVRLLIRQCLLHIRLHRLDCCGQLLSCGLLLFDRGCGTSQNQHSGGERSQWYVVLLHLVGYLPTYFCCMLDYFPLPYFLRAALLVYLLHRLPFLPASPAIHALSVCLLRVLQFLQSLHPRHQSLALPRMLDLVPTISHALHVSVPLHHSLHPSTTLFPQPPPLVLRRLQLIVDEACELRVKKGRLLLHLPTDASGREQLTTSATILAPLLLLLLLPLCFVQVVLLPPRAWVHAWWRADGALGR